MRATRAIAALALIPLLGACGSSTPPPGPAGDDRTGAYVAAARASLDTPAKMASLLSRGLTQGAVAPSPAETGAVVSELARDVESLRRLRLSDPDLSAQRTRLANALESLLPTMKRVTAALDADDRRALSLSGNAFLDQVRSLPSRLDAPSP